MSVHQALKTSENYPMVWLFLCEALLHLATQHVTGNDSTDLFFKNPNSTKKDKQSDM